MTADDKRIHRRARIKRECRERQRHLRHTAAPVLKARQPIVWTKPVKPVKPVKAPTGFVHRVMAKIGKFIERRKA